MNENNKTLSTGHYLYLVLAFAACYLAIGIPYWQTSYSSVSLPNSLYGPGLLLMFICALFFCSRGTRFLWSATVLGLSAPAAVATRIIVDVARDNSTHNLFPFEIAIAVIVGFGVAGVGAGLGVLSGRLFKPDAEK